MAEDGIVTQVINGCPSPESDLKYGTQLVDGLIISSHKVTIEQGPSGNTIYNAVASSNGKGTDARVLFNATGSAKDKVELLTEDSDGNIGYTATPAYIVLGHELIHADSAMKGIMPGNNIFGKPKTMTYTYTENRKKVTSSAKVEELATVGLAKNKNRAITENKLRQDHGLPMRIKY